MESSYVKSVFDARDLPRDRLPEIAVAGKSNVGKSSLLNKVMGRRGLAKTSRTPGKTRCLNYYLVPDRPVGLMALFDARREVDEPEKEWLDWLRAWGRPYLVVLTKTDKLSGNERARALQRWQRAAGDADPVMFSAVTAQGKDKLWQWIDDVRKAPVRR